MKRILLEVGGWALIVLGIAGLFLPILPGLLFLLIGLTVLSANHHWARLWIDRLREHFPRADAQLQRFLRKHFRHIPGGDTTPVSK